MAGGVHVKGKAGIFNQRYVIKRFPFILEWELIKITLLQVTSKEQ